MPADRNRFFLTSPNEIIFEDQAEQATPAGPYQQRHESTGASIVTRAIGKIKGLWSKEKGAEKPPS